MEFSFAYVKSVEAVVYNYCLSQSVYKRSFSELGTKLHLQYSAHKSAHNAIHIDGGPAAHRKRIIDPH